MKTTVSEHNWRESLPKSVTSISATGTTGEAAGKQFFAKPNRSGLYVLNKKTSAKSANPTNKAVNKIYAKDLTEAANLLATDLYHINLVSPEGKRALPEFCKVRIEWT